MVLGELYWGWTQDLAAQRGWATRSQSTRHKSKSPVESDAGLRRYGLSTATQVPKDASACSQQSLKAAKSSCWIISGTALEPMSRMVKC